MLNVSIYPFPPPRPNGPVCPLSDPRSEWNGLPHRGARPHGVLLLIIDYHYLSSFFYGSSLSSPAQQLPTLQSCDSGRNDMRPNHSPSYPHCLALSHLFLSSRAVGQRLPTQRRYILTPLYPTPITDTSEIATTIQNLDTAERRPRMYIGPPSYSLTRGISLITLNQKFPVHCCVSFSP